MALMNQEHIDYKIFTIRNNQVMLDKDLAELYRVETKVLNQAVKRNIDRFPDTFRFQINEKELESLRSQSVTSSLSHGGRRYMPFAFTEQGVAMLSAVLRNETAIKVSIQIIKAFVKMRQLINHSGLLQERLVHLEIKQQDNEKNFEKVFKALEKATPEPKHGIFFEGQIFDAYTFIAKIIKSAKKSIILVGNYNGCNYAFS